MMIRNSQYIMCVITNVTFDQFKKLVDVSRWLDTDLKKLQHHSGHISFRVNSVGRVTYSTRPFHYDSVAYREYRRVDGSSLLNDFVKNL